jgi:hypothetical protein
MDQFDRRRFQTPEKRKELLDEIVDTELLAEDARKNGLDKEPETQESIRQILRDALLAEARKGVRAPADIPAAEVKAWYDAHKDDFRDPERRRVAIVVCKDEATATKVVGEARKATPMQWGELVQRYSAEPVPKPGPSQPLEMSGDLGLVGAPGDARGDNRRVDPAVRAALFSLAKVGDVADAPVKVPGGFAVVRMTGRNDAHERTLQEAERSIRVSIVQADIADREKKLEAELRAKFPVTIDEKALAGDPTLTGHVVLSLKIASNGQVCSATVKSNEMSDPSVATCAANTYLSQHLPPPRGGCANIDMPINYKPAGQ